MSGDIYQQVAREICAAVAEDMLCLNHAQAYREGRFDDKRPIGMIKELAAPYGIQEGEVTIHYSAKEDKYWIRSGDDVLWFDSVLEAKEAVRRAEIDAAVKAERAAILAYLNRVGGAPTYLVRGWISTGEHLAGGDDGTV